MFTGIIMIIYLQAPEFIGLIAASTKLENKNATNSPSACEC